MSQPAPGGEGEAKVRLFREGGLNEQDRFLGIDTRAQPVEDDLPGVFPEMARIGIIGSQGVPIGDKKVAVILGLEPPPVFKGPKEVAQMKPTRRPHATQDPSLLHPPPPEATRVTGVIPPPWRSLARSPVPPSP